MDADQHQDEIAAFVGVDEIGCAPNLRPIKLIYRVWGRLPGIAETV